jgi:hypothetical protein
MMDSILEQSEARSRHRLAPLLKEREQFLSHMLGQGARRRLPGHSRLLAVC